MRVRQYNKKDLAQIAKLFYDTIHKVNKNDYSPQQIQAWAPNIYPVRYWSARFRNHIVLVVEERQQILGFAEFENTGHIDCFYVHHAWQGRGVGSLLMAAIERRARRLRVNKLFGEVSLTAKPFFENCGFATGKKLKKFYHNQRFSQFVMYKHL